MDRQTDVDRGREALCLTQLWALTSMCGNHWYFFYGCISPGISVSSLGEPGFGFFAFLSHHGVFVAAQLSCSIFSMWDLSSLIRPGIEPCVPYIEVAGFLTSDHQGSPSVQLLTRVSGSSSSLLSTPCLAPVWVCASPFQSVFKFYQYLHGSRGPLGRGLLLALLCVFQPQLHIGNIWEGDNIANIANVCWVHI